jgi:uncharacterized protein YdaU (DUF1376 family)
MAKQFDKQWYPFYHDLFNRSTAGWAADRVGAYILLLNHQWQNDGIPTDKDELIFIAKCSHETLDKVLLKFSQEKNGKLYNKKMEIVRKEQIEKYEKRANAGKQGGTAKYQNLSNAKAMLKQNVSKSLPLKNKNKNNTFLKESDYVSILTNTNLEVDIKNLMVLHFRNRLSNKKTLTEGAAKILVAKIQSWRLQYSEQEIKSAIEDAITNNWTGIFEPKINKSQQPVKSKTATTITVAERIRKNLENEQ